jgi:hypothetical protein
MQDLEQKISQLTPESQHEVDDFVDFLLAKQRKQPAAAPKLDWAGALIDLRDQYTSVELQHAISAQRSAAP